MIQKIDKYGNTSTDDGRVIVLDKYANIKKVNKAVWGSITGTLTDQTDLTTYLSTNYYPLTSNPAGYITSADVTLQNAYTNSTDGQIILDATRGPVKIKGSEPNSVLFELLDLASVTAISFLSNGDIKIRDNASIYYDAFNSIKFDTANGVSLKSFNYTKADGRIQYATDYTSLYTSRTLIDKGYADAHYLGTGSSLSTASGDAAGTVSGTNLPLTLATVNSNIGTFNNVTVNAKGLVTSASNISYLTTISGIAAGGDLQGTYPNPVVHQIQGQSVQNGSPADKDLLIWDNTASMWKHQQITTITGYNNTNWDTAYTDRNKWDGGSTGLVSATGRTSLGANTVGSNLFTLANPGAITFIQINADNSISTLSASSFRTAIGAGTSSTVGTVTSVAALTLGTTGTDLSSSVANGTTTPVITLNVPTASATNRGVLSSTDWSKFDTSVRSIIKDQNASVIVTGTGETVVGTYFVKANTFSSTDSIKISTFLAEKTGIIGTCTMRIKTSTSSGGFGTAQLLATYTTGITELWCIMQRFGSTIRGGSIRCFLNTLSRQTDIFATSGAISVISFNPAIDNWFFTSLQLSVGTDSAFQSNFTMTN